MLAVPQMPLVRLLEAQFVRDSVLLAVQLLVPLRALLVAWQMVAYLAQLVVHKLVP
jgi:hypothetical protein